MNPENIEEKLNRINEWQKLLSAYRTALTVMSVDGQDAPPEGASFRAEKRALIAGEYQKLRTDKEIRSILSELKAEMDQLPIEANARTVKLLSREMDFEKAVVPEEAAEYQRILDASIRAWPKAKAESDFKGFVPYLSEVISKYRHITELGMSEDPCGTVYDCMLDRHEEGWNTERYDRFFEGIKENVLPLLQEAVTRGNDLPENLLEGHYPINTQRKAMRRLNAYLGFTDEWGRMTESEHPLTSPICAGDVRFTTKYRDNNFTLAVLSTVHETGHAWHAHGIEPVFEGTILAYPSAALSESQSRLCENHLCRSEAFWEANLRIYKHAFPKEFSRMRQTLNAFLQSGDTSGSSSSGSHYTSYTGVRWFTKALNAVHPGPVRLEADELSYPVHILIRYELEKEMFSGSLAVIDLEEAWNEKYRKYLGISPRNAEEGVLQDMHWAWGYFGYFPTYALGSAYAAQIYAAMERFIDVPALLRENHYPEIMTWLREKVHLYGALYPADEILRRVSGTPFDPEYYFRYLARKYSAAQPET